jgi:hypothetical protein
MPTTSRVNLVTCAALPAGDEDGELLLSALAQVGVGGTWRVWDDPAMDWTNELAVVRSTWDYTLRAEQFLAWTRSVPRLANPAAVIAWSADKIYLADLAAAGVPIVPTEWAAPRESVEFPTEGEFVVKPSVGAGSRGAGRFAADDRSAALAHAASLHAAGRTVLVQPYLSAVDTRGETALLYFAGEFSHAVSKGAMLPEGTVHPWSGHSLYVEERIDRRMATDAELAVGAKALGVLRERFGGDLLYVRVDLLPAPEGPVVVELEVAEPSLFLSYGDGAADRFAAAIAAAAA